MAEMPLSSIVVGERHRKDMGDVTSLVDSINDVGLLQPVVVTPDGRLIAGERRLEAFKVLDRETIPTTIVDLDNVVRGEFAENMTRKAFTPSEEVAIYRALASGVATPKGRPPKENPESFRNKAGDTRDKVGAFVGKSGRTLEKQVAVVEAAESEPERFGKLVDDMDRTGRVDGPFKRLKVMKQAEAIRKEPPPLPSKGPYRVIVADPPWPYELRKSDPSHRAAHPYPQQSISDICKTNVAGIAHADAIMWLWTTNHHIREAFTVLDAWGFEQKTILTWVKDRFGTGDWLRGQTEHCLMATRGKPIVELTNQTTVIHGPLRKNSQKPDEFYDFIEKLCPSPRYATLYHRGISRPNWDGHGDEAVNV